MVKVRLVLLVLFPHQVVDLEMVEMEVLVVVLNLMVVLDLLMDHLVEVIIQTPPHLVGAILVEVVKLELLGQVVEEAVLVVVEPLQVAKVLVVQVEMD